MSKKCNFPSLGYYGYALFLLLCNASTLWGVKWGNEITVLFIMIACVVAFTKRAIPAYGLRRLGLILGMFFFTNVINIQNKVNWTSALLFAGELIAIYLIQCFLDIRILHVCIVKCMVFISVLSVITFFISEINSGILKPFMIWERIHGSSYVYIYTPWQTLGWNVFFHRNAGPFWEAGMFACYISISMGLLEFEKDMGFSNREYVWMQGTFVVTLLTTLSTTAYLSLILFSFIKLRKIPKKNKRDTVKKMFITVLVIGIAYALYNTSVVQNKLFTNNSSIEKRMENITGGMLLVKESPLWGLGFRSEVSRHFEDVYISGNCSNGLIQGCYRMGTVLFVVMLYFYYKGYLNIMQKKDAIFAFVWLLFLFGCEPMQIFLLPMSLVFINKKSPNAIRI